MKLSYLFKVEKQKQFFFIFDYFQNPDLDGYFPYYNSDCMNVNDDLLLNFNLTVQRHF